MLIFSGEFFLVGRKTSTPDIIINYGSGFQPVTALTFIDCETNGTKIKLFIFCVKLAKLLLADYLDETDIKIKVGTQTSC